MMASSPPLQSHSMDVAPRASSLAAHMQSISPACTHDSLDATTEQSHSVPAPTPPLAMAAEPATHLLTEATLPATIPPHLQGLSHWNKQRAEWLAKRPAEPVETDAQDPLKPQYYRLVYHKMVRECRLIAPGKRLMLKDAFKVIIEGWKEDGLLPRNFVSAPASPPSRATQSSRPVTPMSLGGDPSVSRSTSTTPPAMSAGSSAGFLGLSSLWKGITANLPG